MGYIREPKNVDLVVAPSALTDENKKAIANAIAQYHKSGKQPISLSANQDSIKPMIDIKKIKTKNRGTNIKLTAESRS